jgi:ADP-ribosyltransferase exoenzyme
MFDPDPRKKEKALLKYHLFQKVLANPDKPIQGPLPLKQETKDIETVVKKVLDAKSGIKFKYADNGNLLAEWKEKDILNQIDLTKAFQGQPNYDHIQLSEEDLDNYLNFLKTRSALAKHTLSISPEFYSQRELKAGITDSKLHLSEKIAIHIYSGKQYKSINWFLRKAGTYSEEWTKTGKKSHRLQIEIGDLLCVIVGATHGLKKMPPADVLKYRELKSLGQAVIEDKINAVRSKEMRISEEFLSTSIFSVPGYRKEKASLIYGVMGEAGRDISAYALFPLEKEILFPPGTPFEHVAHHEEDGIDYIVMRQKMGIG